VQSKWKILIGSAIAAALFFAYSWWSSAIVQPINFSHAQHVKKQIACATCHVNTDTLPASIDCLSCHSGMKAPPEVQWIRVYRVAPDIIFGHAKHTQIPCAECHKQMTAAGRWIHEKRFKMSTCMNCHDEMKASNDCRTCHRNR